MVLIKRSAIRHSCCSEKWGNFTPQQELLFQAFCRLCQASPHSNIPFWVQGTAILCSHRITKCSCIQAQILEPAWSTASIHWPQSSESFWSPPLTKIYNYVHILLPFSTFQLHSNANNSSANRDLWQLETLLMLSHGWFNTSENILIPTAATPQN